MIDCHTHLGGYRISSPKIYGWLSIAVDDLVKYMKDYRIDKVWLLSHPNTVDGYKLANNNEVFDVASSYSNIIPFCSPVDGVIPCGFRGVGEVKVEKPIDDPKLLKIYEDAGDFGLPVVIHSNDKYCYGNNEVFKKVFNKFSGTNFVVHGWNIWNMFSDMKLYLNEYSNVFMDISANSGYLSLKKLPKYYVKAFIESYNDRILFGTDFPMLTTYDGTQFGVNEQHIGLIKSFGLSNSVLDNIFFKNAEKLIK